MALDNGDAFNCSCGFVHKTNHSDWTDRLWHFHAIGMPLLQYMVKTQSLLQA